MDSSTVTTDFANSFAKTQPSCLGSSIYSKGSKDKISYFLKLSIWRTERTKKN